MLKHHHSVSDGRWNSQQRACAFPACLWQLLNSSDLLLFQGKTRARKSSNVKFTYLPLAHFGSSHSQGERWLSNFLKASWFQLLSCVWRQLHCRVKHETWDQHLEFTSLTLPLSGVIVFIQAGTAQKRLEFSYLCLGRFQTWPVPLSNPFNIKEDNSLQSSCWASPHNSSVSQHKLQWVWSCLECISRLTAFSNCAPFLDTFLSACPKNDKNIKQYLRSIVNFGRRFLNWTLHSCP